MLLWGNFIRKYRKSFIYVVIICIAAFIVTLGTEQQVIEINGINGRVVDGILSVRNGTRMSQLVDKQEDKHFTEIVVNITTAKQTNMTISNKKYGSKATKESTSFVLSQEVRHIAFLKVHKAASSTMQNMFFRFGLKRNLTFVFTRHPNYFSRSAHRHLPLVRPKLRKEYDILCNHGIFNHNMYSSLLPKDTVYIGIVRNPLSVFISAVNFYSQKSQQLPYLTNIRGNKLQKLIHQPEIYDRGFFSYTKNVMSRDFGFPESTDSNTVWQKLKELDKTFTLVLIVEYFEESLVLMKRYLNWKIQDILFVPNNVYMDQVRSVSASELNSNDLNKFKVRNQLDYSLYDFFINKFWKQFESERKIKLEVLHFKNVLKNISEFCNVQKKDDNTRYLTIPISEWNEEFSTSIEDCSLMKTDELKFIQILRQKQGSEIRGSIYQGRNRVDIKGTRRQGLQRSRYGLQQRYPRSRIENRGQGGIRSLGLAPRVGRNSRRS